MSQAIGQGFIADDNGKGIDFGKVVNFYTLSKTWRGSYTIQAITETKEVVEIANPQMCL